MKKILLLFIPLVFFFGCEVDNNHNQEPYPYPDGIVIDSLKIHRKVLIIGIDGFRSDIMQESMTPFMFSIQNRNSYYNVIHETEQITYSGPNWTAMLTGVHQNKHNVLDNSFDNYNYNDYPPFFYYLNQANIGVQTSSIVNWTPINNYVLSDYCDYAPENAMNDLTVFENAKQLLLEENPLDVDVLFLQFDELDGAGHSYGFSPLSEEYVNTANAIDSYSSELYSIIENKRTKGEDWMFMMISDHGGEGTSHANGSHPDVNRTIFFAEHPDLQFKTDCCYFSNQTDLASTVLDFLGVLSAQFEYNKDGISVLE
mgnify:FL=1